MRLAGLEPPQRKMRFLPLIAATFFMVSGGPYAIEDILGGAGFATAIVILLVLPFLWSLPTALMIGELASAIPAEGGFYIWVRRALGPFWGYQEGWLSLSASIFDMAIYPAFCVTLPRQVQPRAHRRVARLCLVARPWSCSVACGICAARPRSGDDSVWMFVLLLSPFVVFVVLGLLARLHASSRRAVERTPRRVRRSPPRILVAMWNYMGWDNASTVAQEVENPQRNYPRAMIGSTLLVAVTYILPLLAMACAGLSVGQLLHRRLDDCRGTLGGPLARHGRRRRRRHHRRRHVQCAGDELHAAAHGHGRRRHAAPRRRAPQRPRRAVGQRAALRRWPGRWRSSFPLSG